MTKPTDQEMTDVFDLAGQAMNYATEHGYQDEAAEAIYDTLSWVLDHGGDPRNSLPDDPPEDW